MGLGVVEDSLIGSGHCQRTPVSLQRLSEPYPWERIKHQIWIYLYKGLSLRSRLLPFRSRERVTMEKDGKKNTEEKPPLVSDSATGVPVPSPRLDDHHWDHQVVPCSLSMTKSDSCRLKIISA